MLFLALQNLSYTGLYVYAMSASIYFFHCLLVWKRWSWAKGLTKKPWWIRSNICWKLAGDGYFPLTNGRVVTHTFIALMPFYNTAFIGCSMGYLIVDTICRLWIKYISAWLNTPSSGQKKA